jgi:hypothetical protein
LKSRSTISNLDRVAYLMWHLPNRHHWQPRFTLTQEESGFKTIQPSWVCMRHRSSLRSRDSSGAVLQSRSFVYHEPSRCRLREGWQSTLCRDGEPCVRRYPGSDHPSGSCLTLLRQAASMAIEEGGHVAKQEQATRKRGLPQVAASDTSLNTLHSPLSQSDSQYLRRFHEMSTFAAGA